MSKRAAVQRESRKCCICERTEDSGIVGQCCKNLQIRELKEKIASGIEQKKPEYPLVEDLLEMGDFAVLVVPIDKAAPKGRLILPQQQTIRGVLEAGATAVVVRDDELWDTLQNLGKSQSL